MEAVRFAHLLEKLGTEGLSDLDQWLTEELRNRGVTRDEFREILSRLDVVEKRVDNVERRLDSVERRMESLEGRMNDLTSEIQHLRVEMYQQFERMNAQINERFDRMNERMDRMMRWTVGMIGMVGAGIAALITVFKFIG